MQFLLFVFIRTAIFGAACLSPCCPTQFAFASSSAADRARGRLGAAGRLPHALSRARGHARQACSTGDWVSINRMAEGQNRTSILRTGDRLDHGSLKTSINSSLVIPACLKINNNVELLISLWFGKVSGVLLPSGLTLLIEM